MNPPDDNAMRRDWDAPARHAMLSEVARVLAPGGLFAGTFASAEPPPVFSAADRALFDGPTWHGHCFTRPALLAALSAAGLAPQQVDAMDIAWNVIAERT